MQSQTFFLVASKVDDAFMKPQNLYADSRYSENTYLQDHFKENVDDILFGVKNSVMFRRGIARMKQVTM